MFSKIATLASLMLGATFLLADELPDITTVPDDLQVPAMMDAAPAAGRRVRQTTPGWKTTDVHHALYLPSNWKRGKKFPVLVEYAGNGGFKDKFGDTCDGTVEGCHLGYGISGGLDYIWIAMPFFSKS